MIDSFNTRNAIFIYCTVTYKNLYLLTSIPDLKSTITDPDPQTEYNKFRIRILHLNYRSSKKSSMFLYFWTQMGSKLPCHRFFTTCLCSYDEFAYFLSIQTRLRCLWSDLYLDPWRLRIRNDLKMWIRILNDVVSWINIRKIVSDLPHWWWTPLKIKF